MKTIKIVTEIEVPDTFDSRAERNIRHELAETFYERGYTMSRFFIIDMDYRDKNIWRLSGHDMESALIDMGINDELSEETKKDLLDRLSRNFYIDDWAYTLDLNINLELDKLKEPKVVEGELHD